MRSFEVTAARLPQTRLGTRYAVAQVDDFLDEAAAALTCWEGGTPSALHADDVVHKEFRSVALFGAGYDADAVDDLLDRVAVQLREYEPGAQLQADQERQDERQVRGMLERAQQELRDKRGEA